MLNKLFANLRPNSLPVMVLVGFFLASLPLLIAVISSVYAVDELATVSRQTVFQSVKATQGSRILLEKVVTLERLARQYLVLEDKEIAKNYADVHQSFAATARELIALQVTSEFKQELNKLIDLESALYRYFMGGGSKSEGSDTKLKDFIKMNKIAREMWRINSQLVYTEVQNLDQASQNVQTRILGHIVFLLPTSLLLVVFFVSLIAKPIKQLDGAIRNLGRGNFVQPLKVSGPRDLEYLGERLEWLRVRLIRLEDEKQNFLRHVTHDLKTPLASIKEGADLLADEVVGKLNSEQSDIATILKTSSSRLSHLIQGLLDYSRIHSERSELNIVRISLAKFIDQAVENYKVQLKSKKIKLSLNVDDIDFFADIEKMKTIIDNLLSNAVKYSPPEGRIQFDAKSIDNIIVFDIMDQGPGLESGEKNQVFDLFFQGQSAKTRDIEGSGIGLAILKEFVSAHDGVAEVLDNENDVWGGHFRITIPKEPIKQ